MTENKKSWQSKMGRPPADDSNYDKNVNNSQENAKNTAQNEESDIKNGQNVENEAGNMQNQLKQAEEKAVDLNNKLLRVLAELENTRRRSREEQIKTSNYAISNFVTDLAVVTENFFLACENLPEIDENTSNELKNLVKAVEMTKNEMMKVLEKHKVKRIYPLNQKFDHNIHEAVSYVQNEAEEGDVINVVQAGYVLGDRIIRPSLVVVSSGKSD